MNKILYVSGGPLDYGGITSVIYNYCANFSDEYFQIDIVAHGSSGEDRDEDFEKLGVNVYHVPYKRESYNGWKQQIKGIIRNGNYKIIHCHTGSTDYFILKMAKRAGIPCRITHAHCATSLSGNTIKNKAYELIAKDMRRYATDFFACSSEAAIATYGKNVLSYPGFRIINNAIDEDEYRFDPEKSKTMKERYGLENCYVIGHAGHFSLIKNQTFLVQVIKEYSKIDDTVRLVLCGDGELIDSVKQLVQDNNLDKYVLFMGQRSDMQEMYQMFDVFALPSLSEGLSLVTVEAQMNGLPCVLSKNVPLGVRISDCVYFEELKVEQWMRKFDELKGMMHNNQVWSDNKYNIKTEAKKLENFYLQKIGINIE